MDVFVARQPIFNRACRTYGYELLFRSGVTNLFDHPDPELASVQVLDAAFNVLGIGKIAGRKRAFVNFTRQTLLGEFALTLPGDQLVVEILEDVPPDAAVLAACRALRKRGHLIALDDFVGDARREELIPVADIIKVDFTLTGPEERARLAKRLRPLGLKLLAEKVATWADVREALHAGYHYFQGYFFSAPEIVAGKEVSTSKLNRLKLLREVYRPDADLARIEDIIKREVAFTLKLLTHLNSAGFGFSQRIHSVHHALLLLGETGVRKWASVVALADLGDDKPFELVVMSVVRARFCEELFLHAGLPDRADEGFFLGLFSMLDALLDQPLYEALRELPIAADVRAALLGADTLLGRLYRLAVDYERGHWDGVTAACAMLGVDQDLLPGLHLKAVEWGHSTTLEPGR
jgi:c-di-GMP-related signal transduction protein